MIVWEEEEEEGRLGWNRRGRGGEWKRGRGMKEE